MTKTLPTLALLALLLPSLSTAASQGANPPAPGFDSAGSDTRAVEIADRVMEALGGRGAWDATRHVRWRFFGRRLHVWDKHTGDIRVEGVDRESGDPYVVLMNLHTGTGRAWRAGTEIEDADELSRMLDLAEGAWINDSYWMFMPYKLKDSGVTLRYLGEDQMADGRRAEVLELTFEAVGRTPENKYHVYVGVDSDLVEQWDFFATAADESPRFTTPWGNWQRFGDILLSDDRGDSDHSEIAIFAALPDSVYGDPGPVDWSSLER